MRRPNAGRAAALGPILCALLAAVTVGAGRARPARADDPPELEESDPPEVAIGERLFLETRFAELFARFLAETPGATVNDPLPAGDPALDSTATTSDPLPGPFAGRSMNCRACHLVDEQLDEPGGGMRTYGDFARRSPVPAREDGLVTSARNAPPLVGASRPRPGGVILHFDGEFPSLPDLVRGTIAGRNYGWRVGERALAVAHVARVVREDDGTGDLAAEFGGAYADVLAGAPDVPDELRLPPELRLDVASSGDEAIFDAVAELVSVYVAQLEFASDEDGAHAGSPYDVFLARNDLPRQPDPGESAEAYTARLRRAIARLHRPVFVDDGPFAFHDRERRFGPVELAGLRTFLEAPERARPTRRERRRGGVGDCAACHPAPDFTDFGFHDTGVTQAEYDAAHRPGAFRRLFVPGLLARQIFPDRWLPATEAHPDAAEPFRRPADPDRPRHTDLGAWNVFANPDFPDAQEKLGRALCQEALDEAGLLGRAAFAAVPVLCHEARLLRRSLARFKTPGLRDLGHSAPYFHNGAEDDLEGVVAFYRRVSRLERQGRLRNGDPELSRIALRRRDVEPLVAFLRSLDEDYE